MSRFALLIGCSLTITLTAQQPAPRFEVVSVKPVKGSGYHVSTPLGGAFRATVPLEWLIGMAYDIRPFERIVGEPGWVRTQWFEVDARPGGPVTSAETMGMLRTLLEDRFRLKWRKDPTAKDMVWALMMARDDKRLGPAIRVSECVNVSTSIPPVSERQLRPGQPVPCGVSSAESVYGGGGQPIRMLATTIQVALGEEVLDRTGLTGGFDFYVTLPSEGGQPADAGAPSIFTAVRSSSA
jgi:uncharacterized protein (TIGR03435 family)